MDPKIMDAITPERIEILFFTRFPLTVNFGILINNYIEYIELSIYNVRNITYILHICNYIIFP